MIVMSAEFPEHRVFLALVLHTPVGDIMNKSGTMLTAALLTFGLAAGVMTADAQQTAAPAAAATTPAAK